MSADQNADDRNENHMLDENARKAVALEYCRRVNAGDVDGVLALFADPLRVDDPVGGPSFRDRAAYRAHLERLVAARVHETPGTPVATLDDESVALPITVVAQPPEVPPGSAVRMNVVAVLSVGADGRIHRMQVFCGRTDMTLVSAE